MSIIRCSRKPFTIAAFGHHPVQLLPHSGEMERYERPFRQFIGSLTVHVMSQNIALLTGSG